MAEEDDEPVLRCQFQVETQRFSWSLIKDMRIHPHDSSIHHHLTRLLLLIFLIRCDRWYCIVPLNHFTRVATIDSELLPHRTSRATKQGQRFTALSYWRSMPECRGFLQSFYRSP